MNKFIMIVKRIFVPNNADDTVTGKDKSDAIEDIFGQENEFNVFYDNTSVFYRIVEFVLLAAFLFYFIFSAFGNVGSITEENLDYILRNFALKLEENESQAGTVIQYNPDANMSFSSFGKGLAVCSASNLSIFSATGRQICNEQIDYLRPVMKASSKYVVLYDEGTRNYSVFNSFTKVYNGECDYTISSVDVSDNGYYAIVTKDIEYNSSVEVYNSNFKLVNRYLKNDYVIGTDINNNNVLIATLGVDSNGNYLTELIVGTHGQSEVDAQAYVEKHFPLECGLTDDGFYLLSKEALLFFDSNGNVISQFEYKDKHLSLFSVDTKGALLLFKEDSMNKEYLALVVDKSGREVSSLSLQGSIWDVLKVGDDSYILTDKGIYNMKDSSNYFEEYTRSDIASKLIAYSENKIYICNKTNAPLIEIKRG